METSLDWMISPKHWLSSAMLSLHFSCKRRVRDDYWRTARPTYDVLDDSLEQHGLLFLVWVLHDGTGCRGMRVSNDSYTQHAVTLLSCCLDLVD